MRSNTQVSKQDQLLKNEYTRLDEKNDKIVESYNTLIIVHNAHEGLAGPPCDNNTIDKSYKILSELEKIKIELYKFSKKIESNDNFKKIKSYLEEDIKLTLMRIISLKNVISDQYMYALEKVYSLKTRKDYLKKAFNLVNEADDLNVKNGHILPKLERDKYAAGRVYVNFMYHLEVDDTPIAKKLAEVRLLKDSKQIDDKYQEAIDLATDVPVKIHLLIAQSNYRITLSKRIDVNVDRFVYLQNPKKIDERLQAIVNACLPLIEAIKLKLSSTIPVDSALEMNITNILNGIYISYKMIYQLYKYDLLKNDLVRQLTSFNKAKEHIEWAKKLAINMNKIYLPLEKATAKLTTEINRVNAELQKIEEVKNEKIKSNETQKDLLEKYSLEFNDILKKFYKPFKKKNYKKASSDKHEVTGSEDSQEKMEDEDSIPVVNLDAKNPQEEFVIDITEQLEILKRAEQGNDPILQIQTKLTIAEYYLLQAYADFEKRNKRIENEGPTTDVRVEGNQVILDSREKVRRYLDEAIDKFELAKQSVIDADSIRHSKKKEIQQQLAKHPELVECIEILLPHIDRSLAEAVSKQNYVAKCVNIQYQQVKQDIISKSPEKWYRSKNSEISAPEQRRQHMNNALEDLVEIKREMDNHLGPENSAPYHHDAHIVMHPATLTVIHHDAPPTVQLTPLPQTLTLTNQIAPPQLNTTDPSPSTLALPSTTKAAQIAEPTPSTIESSPLPSTIAAPNAEPLREYATRKNEIINLLTKFDNASDDISFEQFKTKLPILIHEDIQLACQQNRSYLYPIIVPSSLINYFDYHCQIGQSSMCFNIAVTECGWLPYMLPIPLYNWPFSHEVIAEIKKELEELDQYNTISTTTPKDQSIVLGHFIMAILARTEMLRSPLSILIERISEFLPMNPLLEKSIEQYQAYYLRMRPVANQTPKISDYSMFSGNFKGIVVENIICEESKLVMSL